MSAVSFALCDRNMYGMTNPCSFRVLVVPNGFANISISLKNLNFGRVPDPGGVPDTWGIELLAALIMCSVKTVHGSSICRFFCGGIGEL